MKSMKKYANHSNLDKLNNLYDNSARKITNKSLRLIFSICINWLFQGITVMDRTETVFKIFLDLFLATILLIILIHFFSFSLSLIVICLIIAHTLNWALNGHFFVLILDFSNETPSEKFQKFCQMLKNKIDFEPSIQAAAIFGSVAKKKFHNKSDLDIGIIRNQGIINGIRACFFVLLIRIYAVINRLPVDLFLVDHKDHLLKFWKEKEPVVLNDKNKIFNSGLDMNE